jgi:hypothetical protein
MSLMETEFQVIGVTRFASHKGKKQQTNKQTNKQIAVSQGCGRVNACGGCLKEPGKASETKDTTARKPACLPE